MPSLSKSGDDLPENGQKSTEKGSKSRKTPAKSSNPEKTTRSNVNAKKSATQIRLTERRMNVMTMRANMVKFQTIADTLGISVSTAHDDYNRMLDDMREMTNEATIRIRNELILQRKAMIEAHAPVALDPEHERSVASAGIVDKNMTALAKIYGLESPQMIQHFVSTEKPIEDQMPKIVIEVAGESDIDWEAAKEDAERNRKIIDYKPPPEDDEDEPSPDA